MGNDWNIETKCVQEGWKPKNGEPRVLPIAQSTTFKYDNSQTLGDLFDLKIDGDIYTRISNPTSSAVEAKIAALEGGVGALLTSAGQAASFMSVINIAHSGDHIISSVSIYGGTFNLFDKTLREMGIDITFVDVDASAKQLDAAFRPNTKLVFGETLSNPGLCVLDIEKFAHAAHKHGVPLIVDNSFPTPINCRPFEFGADIVVHSTSKYLDGHATALGGVIVDSGNFDWAASDKYPGLTAPDETYHGLIYTENFGRAAYITKCRTHLIRDLGTTPSPMNAFYLNQGIDTLHLRMERHCSNAQKVAEYLERDERITWVNYPGLESNKYYELAQKYLPKGSSGVISFGVKGGREAACRFMDNLKLAAIVTHVADLRTSVLHPASTTHRQMSDEQLKAAGVSPDMIRFSVGIENADDIIQDISQALSAL
ncbi:MAG: O-acetylhomoserine aminocarboxypropyltransferase/cysteine synthase [Oscillospiraceae bacterium]|nr:O-acetylhomoserine aminocarboxypropyltransferase/cysteine synthase [Oscillospiraceae bacterium]MDD4413383.1 O-acetylhomoserine aminocarboxypropyltransferase/cysteine synthase [Oscillospiraceae bacterium]